MPPTSPTFMVIGAQKCGTTWLAGVLAQHPDVFVAPVKEVHYYDDVTRHARGLDWYLSHFDRAGAERAVGEATPNYLWTRATDTERAAHHVADDMPAAIRADFPDLRLVVCLRDPVERAVSGYYHSINTGYLSPSSRLVDVMDTFGIITMSRYADSLRDWFASWPRDRFEIVIYEDDIRDGDKRATVDRVCSSIGVGPVPEDVDLDVRYNARPGGAFLRLNHRSPLAARVARRLVPAFESWDAFGIEVRPDDVDEIRVRLAGEVDATEDLLGRDLACWRRD